jgi:hypothetical protein
MPILEFWGVGGGAGHHISRHFLLLGQLFANFLQFQQISTNVFAN